MSSILDALKKLEEEKTEAAQAAPVELDEVVAERELVGAVRRRRDMTIRLTPVTAGVALLGITILLVLVSTSVSWLMARPASTSTVAAVPPALATESIGEKPISTPASVPAIPAAPVAPVQTAPPTPAPVTATSSTPPAAPQPTPAPTEPAQTAPSTAAPPAAPPILAQQTPAVSPGASDPSTLSKRSADPEVTAPRSLRPPLSEKTAPRSAPRPPAELPRVVAAPAPSPGAPDFDLYSLPILTETDKVRLGLKGLEVNMLRSPSKNRPSPSALINMQQVYVNEIISGTSARLIAVDIRGIGIEVGGERYFVRK